jgi:hypothetical protein
MIHFCHRCEWGAKGIVCAGSVPCRQDEQRRDITVMVKLGCPVGHFKGTGECERCKGPHATETCPLPEGFDVEQERRRMQQGGCCATARG